MADAVVISELGDEELRTIAVAAHGAQLLVAAVDYGLLAGGFDFDMDRAEDVVGIARERGLEWTDDEATAAAVRLMAEWNEAASC